MSTKYLSPTIRQRFFDDNGDPLAGGKLYTYAAGSTTPKASYQDHMGETVNANPIILDANGECRLWLSSGNYKIVLKDADGVEQWSEDYVSSTSAAESVAAAGGNLQISNVLADAFYAPAGSGAESAEEFGLEVFKFPSPEDADNIVINGVLKVPEDYAGGDIEIRLGVYTPSYSVSPTTNNPAFQMKLTAALIKAHADGDTGYRVDELDTSEIDSVQLSVIPATVPGPGPGIVDGKPYVHRVLTFVLADGGEIDSEVVTPGSRIFLQITRIPYTPDASLYIEDTGIVRVAKAFMEVIYS